MKIGYAMCGSYCTHAKSLAVLEELVKVHTVVPIVSENVASTDTRFGRAADLVEILTSLCGRAPICTIAGAEPLGPKEALDMLVIAPCTGNTLAKMAHGIRIRLSPWRQKPIYGQTVPCFWHWQPTMHWRPIWKTLRSCGAGSMCISRPCPWMIRCTNLIPW